jgi:hypothetical protein
MRKPPRDGSPSGDDYTGSRRMALAAALDDMGAMQLERTQRPRKIIHEWVEECLQRVRPRHGESWSMDDVWKLENYDDCRNTGRFANCLAEAVELGIRGEHDASLATVICTWIAMHQTSIDKGSYRLAERLSRVKDPYGKTRFAGTARELTIAAGAVKAEEELKAKTTYNPLWKPPAPEQASPVDPSAAGGEAGGGAPRGRGRGKKK